MGCPKLISVSYLMYIFRRSLFLLLATGFAVKDPCTLPSVELDLVAVGDVKRIMRATNTTAVTSIDGARVDGDWRVTEKREVEKGRKERERRAQRSSLLDGRGKVS